MYTMIIYTYTYICIDVYCRYLFIYVHNDINIMIYPYMYIIIYGCILNLALLTYVLAPPIGGNYISIPVRETLRGRHAGHAGSVLRSDRRDSDCKRF